MERDIHEYEGADVTVTYDVKRCIHVRECVRGLPEVFDPDARPWITPDDADADALAEVVTRCPTGALHFEREDGESEAIPEENTVEVASDGPLYVRGDVEITAEDGTTLLSDVRVALCRCGASGNKPLCDNSHLDVGFDAPGAVDEERSADDESAGELRVTPTANGPFHLEGPFDLVGEEGGPTYRDDDAWLCRCGGSGSKPFCDGTHEKIGFTAEDG